LRDAAPTSIIAADAARPDFHSRLAFVGPGLEDMR
jgi:hypothetical protein